MSFPYDAVFLALLALYMAYSIYARMDSRYPIAAALGLLVVAAILEALGIPGMANTLATFVFFLLGGGVLLLLVDHVRDEDTRRLASASGGLSRESPEEEPATTHAETGPPSTT